MRGKEDLFHLIQAMSKSEKRYFSLDAKKSGREAARYLNLFKAINGMDEYNEEKLKKKFPDTLAMDKVYLYEAILRSMRDYRSAKSKAAQVKERLIDSEYLHERGLYNQSYERLASAKSIVTELQDQFTLLEINVDELQFHVDTKRRLFFDQFQKLSNEKTAALEAISQELQYLDLYFKLSFKVLQEFELKDEKSKQQLRADIPLQLLDVINFPKSARAQRRYHLCQAMFFRLIGETEKVYHHFSMVVKWWDEHPAIKNEEFHRYVIDVSNLVNTCYQYGKYLNEAQQLQDKLQKEGQKASFHGQRTIFSKLSIANLLHHLNQGDFPAAAEMLPSITEGINKFGLRKSVVLIANIISVLFLVEDYKNCIFWCDHIIQNIKTGGRKDIFRIVRLYKLISLFELDLLDELDSNKRSTDRFFKSEQVQKDSFLWIVYNNHLKKIFSAPLSELKDTYKNLEIYLLDIKTQVGDNTPLGLDEIRIWNEKNLGV